MPVDPPPLLMSVSERIRYFESRRSSNVYIVGHGARYSMAIEEGTVQFMHRGKLRTDDDYSGDVSLDTGGLGVTYADLSFKAGRKFKKRAAEFSDADYAKAAKKKGLALQPPPGKFRVPMGMTIYFYCKDEQRLNNDVARLIEGFSHRNPGIKPVEVIAGGGFCFNYRLSFPSGLHLNVSPLRLRHDVIMLDAKRGNAKVPLSTILRDPRCENATIHWMACREVVANVKLDGRNEKTDGDAKNVKNYMDFIGGEPVNNVRKSSAYKTSDDRQELADSGVWE